MGSFDTKVTFKTIAADVSKSDSAIKEAIANAIDANCENIYINLYEKKAVDTIVDVSYFCLDIADDGEGIPTNSIEFEEVFCQYKVSSKDKKSQYGKKGKGRYTYLTLAEKPENVSIYTTNKNNETYKISFLCRENENIKINQTKYNDKINTPIELKYTTLIQFLNLDVSRFDLNDSKEEEVLNYIKAEIISFFADRIASKTIKIYLNDELLDTDNYLERDVITTQSKIKNIQFSIDYYFWNDKIKLKADRQKHILLFDDNNILKGILPSGKHKVSFDGKSHDHSIIVKSDHFNSYNSNEIDTTINLFTDKIVVLLKKEIEIKVEEILFEIYQENINKVSSDYLTHLNISEDEITQNVYHALLLPFIEKFGNKKVRNDLKPIIVKLINVLASTSPDAFINNLKMILSLTDSDSKTIDYIQQNYGIVKAITEKEQIIGKIDFLNKFNELVNGKARSSVQERSELHKVVEKNLWLIDESFEGFTYSDIASDESLKSILENTNFYQFDSDILGALLKEYKLNKIPDIYIPLEHDDIIYIIELKKPTVAIDRKILDEVEDKYVKAVNAINKQYTTRKKKIIAYAISDIKRDNARARGNKQSDDVYIEPKCWSELIENARSRYNAKIKNLDHKLKESKWQDLSEFILTYKNT